MSDQLLIEELRNKIAELERKVKRYREYYSALFDSISLPVFIKDSNGVYTNCNEAFVDFIGLTRSEVIGKTAFDIVSPEMAQVYHEADLELIKNKNSQVYQSTIKHADGTQHEVVFNKVFIEGNTPESGELLGLITDVTPERRLKESVDKLTLENENLDIKLEQAREKELENDKLKSVFLANMSHEIRTPMNGILGFAELLRDEDLTQEERIKYLDIIKNRGKLLLKIINDVISISKIDTNETTLNPMKTSINSLVNDLYKSYYSRKTQEGKEDVNLRVFKELSEGEDVIEVDNVKLEQILSSLLDNAFKFTNKGWIDFGYEVINDKLRFFVKDTGKGIAKEKISQVFERFRQEDESPTRKYGGAGLGLSIAKAFADIMGGEMSCESELEKGSSFYLTIPFNRIIEENQNDRNVDSSDLNFDWSDFSILIVEDDYASYEYMRNILSKTKVKISWADNGRKAIEMFLVKSGFDLVLMDIQLPDVDGYFATKEIKSISPEVPIIAQTAHAFPEDEEKCRNAGCDDFVTKPINKKVLLPIINNIFVESQQD